MLCIGPRRVEGSFRAPPSKPVGQRLLLASALAEGETEVVGLEWSDDVVAMLRAVMPLAEVRTSGDVAAVRPREPPEARAFSVMESGFTLRTATAVYAGVPGVTAIYFGGSLRGRPMGELVEALRRLSRVELLPGAVVVWGRRLARVEVEVPAHVSSQYISGLMFLSTLAEGGGAVRPLGERRSWQYVEATAEVLRMFGAEVRLGEAVEVRGRLRSPGGAQVLGDYSLSAFLMVGALITGGRAEVVGLPEGGPDSQVLDLLRAMGASVERRGGAVEVYGGLEAPLEADMSSAPDLVMPLALAAAFVKGESVLRGVEHLRYKESDRIATTLDVLRRMGVRAEYRDGALAVRGPPAARNVHFSSHGDHRIALMAMTAARALGGCIDDVSPVAKSWPSAVALLA